MIANEEIEVEGKRVLELGCGVGLPGMIAASKGAQMVVLSDFNDSRMLDDLKDSVDEALVSSDRVRARIVGHTFGESTRPLLAAVSPASLDVIFVADCIWNRCLHAPLLDTLVDLLQASSDSTVVHFTCGFHTGRQVVAEFIESASSRGIVISTSLWSPVEVSVEGEKRSWDPGRANKMERGEEKQEERNRWTFVATFVLDR